jgi:hypothetical protein
MAWWLTAWLHGRASPDDLVSAVLDGDAAHHVAGVPGHDDLVPFALALGAIRSSGATGAGLALPAEGDPVGLGGPAFFNAEALEAGEAVVLVDGGAGLVPLRLGRGVVWHWQVAARRQVPDIGEADRSLRGELIAAANALAALDVARWRPEVADELSNLQHRTDPVPAPGTPPRCVDLASRGLQALAIVDLALADDGAAITAAEIEQRRAALAGLGAAGRRALVAACSPEGWPPS